MSEVPALSDLKKEKTSYTTVTQVVMNAYKSSLLKTETGRIVLANLCWMGSFFEFAKDHDDMVRQNFVKQILCNCGVWDDKKSMDIVRKLSELI